MAAVLAVCAASAFAGVHVDCDPEATFHWRTCSADRTTVNWVWPAGAARAVLCVVSGSATNEVALTPEASSWAWSAPAAPAISSFTLTFFDASGAELAGETLHADGIASLSGDGAEVAATDAAFTRVKGRSAILPIPADAGALVIDGVDQGLASEPCPYWFGWTGIVSGLTHTLDLANGDSATLRAIAGGSSIVVR